MTLSFVENFDAIMSKLEADDELTQLKAKMERMKEQRRVAVRKYMKKLRETDEAFQEKERIRARQRYADNREKMQEQKREYMRLNKDNIKKDPEKDKIYYAKLKERMEADPELKEKRLEQQRIRGKKHRELVKADPELREKLLEQQRASREKTKPDPELQEKRPEQQKAKGESTQAKNMAAKQLLNTEEENQRLQQRREIDRIYKELKKAKQILEQNKEQVIELL